MNKKKGMLISESLSGISGILNSEWTANFILLDQYNLIALNSIRNLGNIDKYYRQNSFLSYYVEPWIIINAVESNKGDHNIIFSSQFLNEFSRHLSYTIGKFWNTNDNYKKLVPVKYSQAQVNGGLPFPFDVPKYEILNSEEEYFFSGSFYWYDKLIFKNTSEQDSNIKVDPKNTIIRALEKTYTSLKNKNGKILSLPFSAIFILFNTFTEEIIIVKLGEWKLIGINNKRDLIYFEAKNNYNDYFFYQVENSNEVKINIFDISNSDLTTFIIFNETITRDFVSGGKYLSTCVKKIDTVLSEENSITKKSRILLQWLANYKYFIDDSDRALFVLKKLKNTKNVPSKMYQRSDRVLPKIHSETKIIKDETINNKKETILLNNMKGQLK